MENLKSREDMILLSSKNSFCGILLVPSYDVSVADGDIVQINVGQ